MNVRWRRKGGSGCVLLRICFVSSQELRAAVCNHAPLFLPKVLQTDELVNFVCKQ